MVVVVARPDSFTTWALGRSGAPPELDQAIARSRSFAAAVASAGSATLLACRDERSTRTYVSAPSGRDGESVARSLAAALGAKATPLSTPADAPNLLEGGPVLGWLEASPAEYASHTTQSGGDPSELAGMLARALTPGAWVAVSLRPPSRAELRRARRWFASRTKGAVTHYSSEPEALVGFVAAGGPDRGEVVSTLQMLAAAIPGLDVDARARSASPPGAALAPAIFGVAAWAGVGLHFHSLLDGSAAGALPALTALAMTSGLVPSRSARLADELRSHGAVLPDPPTRSFPPRPPRSESTDRDGRVRRASPGGYPLARSALLLGPAMAIGVASPHAGLESTEATSTRMRRAPGALMDPSIGMLVGYAGDSGSGEAVPVHLDASASYGGVAITGQAGSGKSSLVTSMWAWATAERAAPSGRPGHPGRRNTLIAIDAKGGSAGASGYLAWSAALGDDALFVSIHDASTPRIDLYDSSEADPARRAEGFVNAMVYAFPDGDIQARSYETLVSVFAAVFAADLEAAWAAAELPGEPNPVVAAHILLGASGDEDACSLAAAIATQVSPGQPGADDPTAVAAVRGLGPIFARGVTPSQRRTLTEASRNKVKLLVEARSFWAPDRPRLTFEDLLESHQAVVIDTGSTGGSEVLSTALAGMLAFCLRSAIQRTCVGWLAASRSVTIFADELALLAGSSPEVIAWLRNQGRASGVRLTLATQYPEQLPQAVRDAFLGFETQVIYRQSNPSVIDALVSRLRLDGTDWEPSDLRSLPPWHAVLSTSAGGVAQPAVPIRVAHWGDRAEHIEKFIADQGFALPGAARSMPESLDPWSGEAGPPDPGPDRDPYSTGSA